MYYCNSGLEIHGRKCAICDLGAGLELGTSGFGDSNAPTTRTHCPRKDYSHKDLLGNLQGAFFARQCLLKKETKEIKLCREKAYNWWFYSHPAESHSVKGCHDVTPQAYHPPFVLRTCASRIFMAASVVYKRFCEFDNFGLLSGRKSNKTLRNMNTVLMFVIMGLVCRFKAPGGGFGNLKFGPTL